MNAKTFHISISLILLFSMGMSVNRTACIILLFQWNQKGISETVCEKVIISCEGKCFLKKQMEQKEPLKEQPFSPIAPLNDRNLFSDYFILHPATEVIFDEIISYENLQLPLYYFEYISSLDRPPSA